MKSQTDFLMPFGKHAGLPLSSLPFAYLKFLAKTPPFELRGPLAGAIQKEFQRSVSETQQKREKGVVEVQIPRPLVPLTDKIFEIGLRESAKVADPAVCGSDGTLLAAVDRLRDIIQRQLPQEEGTK